MQMDEREDIIIKYVLEEKKNLKMALDIISRHREICEKIIKPVLQKLEDFICDELNISQQGLVRKLCDEPCGKNYHSFGVLQGPVDILLKGTATNLYIGVFSSLTNEFCNESMEDHLRCHLNKVIGSGYEWKSESGIWYQSPR